MSTTRGNTKKSDEIEANGDVSVKMMEMFERIADKLIAQMNLNFEKHTQILSNDLFNLNKRLDDFQNENKKLKKEVEELKKKNSDLSTICSKLEQKVDQLEQKEMINHVAINGEFQLEPSKAKIVSFINTTMPSAKILENNVLDFQMNKKDGKTFLKIKLDNNATKTKLFQARKQAQPKNIFLSEFLTQRQYQLLQEAKRVAKLGHIKFAWSRNGSIFVKQNETSKPTQIYQPADVQKFVVQ